MTTKLFKICKSIVIPVSGNMLTPRSISPEDAQRNTRESTLQNSMIFSTYNEESSVTIYSLIQGASMNNDKVLAWINPVIQSVPSGPRYHLVELARGACGARREGDHAQRAVYAAGI